MKPTTCIVIDDEPLAVDLLEAYIGKLPELQLVYASTDVLAAVEVLKSQKIDLIFIDIQMPVLTGIELMQIFNQDHFFIITSAYSSYALDAFQFNVVDYLMKPITFHRFYQSVEKFLQWKPREEQPDFLFVNADKKLHKIFYDQIIYIESLKDYVKIYTSQETVMVLENMKTITDKLPTQSFMRVHRSYTISTSKIKLIEGNMIQLQNGIQVPIGETYKKAFMEWLEGY